MAAEVSDSELLDQLRAGSNRGFTRLYRRYYPSIEHFVLQNNGDRDQANDLFQETLIVLLAAIRNPDFALTSSLKTYVFAISRNLWLKQLKKSGRWTSLDEVDEVSHVIMPIEPEPTPTAYERVMVLFNKITVRCMRLLAAIFFGKKQIDDIVRDDNYANIHSAQNQKYKCLQQARRAGGNPAR
ncbi:RNA polymerase sigma factor [Spirosoma sp. KNUC1025]|uniref:RNA polymerase sigma factor n=1 Tax=Spirosoma sp. KNUC1025 TaxID=2894082 RepID=UPI00386E8914|nr:RNA polymerase sigma factor [Spirosoma sp. KNUC1025]